MKRLILLLSAALLFLSACTSEQADPAASFAPAEADRLVVYTSHKEEVYGPIVKEFQARTGIWVQVVTGGTNELLERISAQSAAPVCDVMFGGGVESLAAYVSLFQPYSCSEAHALKPGLRPAGDSWTPFSSLPVVLIHQPKLTDRQEFSGWSDLLDPRWKGKIAFADPTVSGSSYTAVLTLLSCLPGEDWDLLARFAANLDGHILSDSGDVVDAVADGSCSIGVTLEETALRRQAQGAEIEIIYPAEGTSAVPDGTALVAGAPHLDNAQAFLEFVQSKDVQELVVNGFSRRSVRSDVADREDLPPESELSLIDYDLQWASDGKEEFLRRWAELTGEGAS